MSITWISNYYSCHHYIHNRDLNCSSFILWAYKLLDCIVQILFLLSMKSYNRL